MVKIIITDCKYFILIKHLPKNTFDFFQAAQTTEILPNNNALMNKFQRLHYIKFNPLNTLLLLQIGYVIYFIDITNKAHI